VYRSNPLCAASVRCFIPRQSSDALLSIYPEHQWKMENLIRVSLVLLIIALGLKTYQLLIENLPLIH
jgi:hypothetical protein